MGVPAESRWRSQGRRELRLTAEIMDAGDLRRRTVKRFMEDLGSVVSGEERNAIDDAIRHVVQEVKLLAKKEDREGLDSSINELLLLGMQRLHEYDKAMAMQEWISYGSEMISPGLNPFGKYKKQCTSEYDKAMTMQEWISYGSVHL
ncbi:uncharacterized protein LOC114271006 isoform X2 [Camellia sinensis]|uniref:uncharacterized protein LOC114271006 isoform X2 n=1 Tax=Camellia sinensis TaxID=4442 RepID=UPI001035ABAB|nr:uncharacterized protein LOC114271006 isoform X2 [Camellia sinensis]